MHIITDRVIHSGVLAIGAIFGSRKTQPIFWRRGVSGYSRTSSEDCIETVPSVYMALDGNISPSVLKLVFWIIMSCN